MVSHISCACKITSYPFAFTFAFVYVCICMCGYMNIHESEVMINLHPHAGKPFDLTQEVLMYSQECVKVFGCQY